MSGALYAQSYLYNSSFNLYIILSDPNAGTGSHQGTFATGLNNSNEVVGTYRDSSGLTHGFVESGGIYTTLDDPNAASGQTYAIGINNNGVVSGYYVDTSGHYHGFTELNGIYTTVNDPSLGAVNTQLFGINDSNQAAGVWSNSSGQIFSDSYIVPAGAVVPEPSSLTLVLVVGGLGIFGWRLKARGGVSFGPEESL